MNMKSRPTSGIWKGGSIGVTVLAASFVLSGNLLAQENATGHGFSVTGHQNQQDYSRIIEHHLSEPHPEAGNDPIAVPETPPAISMAEIASQAAPLAADVAATPLSSFTKEVVSLLGSFNSLRILEKNGSKWDLVNGQYIPMTANGSPLSASQIKATPSTKVDRPELLPVSGSHQNAPNSIVGRLRGSNPVVQWVYVARKYDYKEPTDLTTFNMSPDVAIIGHHPQTGATAFYQYYHPGNPEDAQVIKSPMNDPDADNFWDAPSTTAGNGCNSCHSADPFIHSPYVQQVKMPSGESVVPSDPLGPYYFIQSGAGEPFSDWAAPQTITSPNNKCTQCHRVGTKDGATVFAKSINNPASSYNLNPHQWMPPLDPTHFLQTFNVTNSEDKALLNSIFTKHYKPDADKLLAYLNGGSGAAPDVTVSTIPTPPNKTQVVVGRDKLDSANNGIYIVDTRMRANTDGVVSQFKFHNKNGTNVQLVVYKMVGSDRDGWKFEVVQSSDPVTPWEGNPNVYSLVTPLPVKAGYYFGLYQQSGAIPYSDDTTWAQGDNPSPVNPYPLGTVALLSEDGAVPDGNNNITFDNMSFRTYSFEVVDELGAFAYSTFDHSEDGWGIYYVQDSGVPADSQPGGLKYDQNKDYLYHHELKGDGVNWYFQAPSRFTRALRTAYGSALRFEIKQALTDNQFDQPRDIMLMGGGKSMYFNTANNPRTNWTSYFVRLTEPGWLFNDGSSVSETDLKTMLSSKDVKLLIRGEFRNGEDESFLDNVWIGPA
jgi:hypothetical protein